MNRPKNGPVLLQCYLAPLLLLGLLYWGTDPALGYVFWRNVFRAGCGPLAGMMPQIGFDPNNLTTYAVTFFVVWSMWIVFAFFSPLKQLPATFHASLSFFWSFFGFSLTLAI